LIRMIPICNILIHHVDGSSISAYLSGTNVQLGATYRVGQASNDKYAAGYAAAAKYVNADVSEIVLGSSTTQNFMNLAASLQIPSGSDIILSKMEHETNVKPWLYMAQKLGLTVKWWGSGKPELKLTPENLKPLLSEKTKFVACTHVSNVLGSIHDLRGIANVVHEAGALFCVDGVSYAPHRRIDVKAFGVDFYGFSWYKVRENLPFHVPMMKLMDAGVCRPHRDAICQHGSTKAHEGSGTLLQPAGNAFRQNRIRRKQL
jgi:selenocysteine lyase/cysteine desulfurase